MDWREEDSNAPVTLEVVTIYRPTRVLAVVCCFVCTLLLIISACPTEWVETRSDKDETVLQREGLFQVCSIPDQTDEQTCRYQERDFVKAVAAVIIISLILTCSAGGLLIFGMCSQLIDLKTTVYRIALISAIVASVLIFIALVVFPSMVSEKLDDTKYEVVWSLGWAYMIDWASLLIIICAAVLLIIDRNPDETSVREKIVNT